MKSKNSVIAISTSTLVVGMAQGALGQLTVNNLYTTIGAGQVVNLDLNGDTVTDYAIRFDGKDSTPSNWNKLDAAFVSSRTQDTGAGASTTYVLGNVDAGQSGALGLPLTGAGTTIGPGYLTAAQLGYIYKDYNGAVVGEWSPTSVSDGYVGLMLTSGGGSVTNFGWVELAYNYNGGTGSTIEVLRTAYDATPNESVVTPAIAVVPEPSTFALAGLAGLLLAARKRSPRN